MKKKKFDNLIGKTKNEIIELLGDEFNYFRSDTWTYIILNKWYMKKTLLILFNKEDIVSKVYIQMNTFFGKKQYILFNK